MWMKISLSHDQLANGRLAEIHDDFAWIFESAGGPADVAMFAESKADVLFTADGAGQFTRKPSVWNLVKQRNDVSPVSDGPEYQALYFSPAAVRLASSLMARFGGTPCKRPQKCSLLVGQDNVAAELLMGVAG